MSPDAQRKFHLANQRNQLCWFLLLCMLLCLLLCSVHRAAAARAAQRLLPPQLCINGSGGHLHSSVQPGLWGPRSPHHQVRV